MNQTPTTASKELEMNASRQFTPWLFEQNLSLGFTTYQAGKLFLIGLQSSGKLSIFERTFERCMGLYAHDSSLYMSSLYQGMVMELYDVVALPGVRRPMAIAFKSDQIRRMVTVG
jgi:Domain of unknown function (DUF4915)